MKVLVTGGAGFIGSHIVDLLLAQDIDVRVLDATNEPGDVRDPSVVARAVDGVDAVCHQAARVGLGRDFSDITDYVSNNDGGTAVLLDALWRRSFRGRLVLASSMVVYGEGRSRCPRHGVVPPRPRSPEDLVAGTFDLRCPFSGCARLVTWTAVDEDSPVDPRNVYAATKLHQEQLCHLWGREASTEVITLRYHNVYGPGMPRDTPYAGVASIFLSTLASGQSPRVFEDGHQTRDFIHVRDVARANLLALTTSGVPSGAYNIASGTPRTVAQMAGALADALGAGSPRPRVTGQWRLGDVRHIVASPRKAAKRLGFVADIPFEAGMAELAEAASGCHAT